MRLRNTWTLLAIALVFLVYFLTIEQPRHHKSLEAERQATLLTELNPADIHHLTINRFGQTLEFSRSDDQWQMDAPVEDLALRANVNALLLTVVQAQIKRSIPTGNENLAQYGLSDPPATVIRLATVTRDTVLTIEVGNYTLTKSHCYARIEDGRDILLLPSDVRHYALLGFSKYRDDRVVRFEIEAVNQFELFSADQAIRWQRTGRSGWATVLQGDTIAGDVQKLEDILHQLRGLRVDRFISDDPAETGLHVTDKSPTIRLWFGPGESPETVRFEPYNGDSCYATWDRGPRLVLTDSAILSVFDKSANDLRDHRLLHFDRGGLGRIGYRTEDLTTTVIKTSREWAYDNPALGLIESSRVESVLSALENLDWLQVIQERLGNTGGFGLDGPFMEISLWDKKGKLVDKLRCGAETVDGNRYATSRSTRLLAEIEADQLAALEAAFGGIQAH